MPRSVTYTRPRGRRSRAARTPPPTGWKGLWSRAGFWQWPALAALCIVVFSIFAWLWNMGWPQQQWRRAENYVMGWTQKGGFAVTEIFVEGRTYTLKDDLMKALAAEKGDPLLATDLHNIGERVMSLPWVKNVHLERRLPNVLYVAIAEHEPMARWQQAGKIQIIDANGAVLTAANPKNFQDLPLIVGTGADKAAAELLGTLQQYPEIYRLLKAAVRVGERRWDLHLFPKLIAKLPEDKMLTALAELAQLLTEQKIQERDIVTVDLRVPGRQILEEGRESTKSSPRQALSPDAQTED
jgi:cell division protein FtsQ